jgi:hypothetical protein
MPQLRDLVNLIEHSVCTASTPSVVNRMRGVYGGRKIASWACGFAAAVVRSGLNVDMDLEPERINPWLRGSAFYGTAAAGSTSTDLIGRRFWQSSLQDCNN